MVIIFLLWIEVVGGEVLFIEFLLFAICVLGFYKVKILRKVRIIKLFMVFSIV